jgi:hypothetical protein
MSFLPEVCPDIPVPHGETPPEGTDLISTIVRHAFLEEAIIRRIADAIANGGDREKVFALAVELVAAQNE